MNIDMISLLSLRHREYNKSFTDAGPGLIINYANTEHQPERTELDIIPPTQPSSPDIFQFSPVEASPLSNIDSLSHKLPGCGETDGLYLAELTTSISRSSVMLGVRTSILHTISRYDLPA